MVVQTVYTAHVVIYRGLPNVKVPSIYLQMINSVIMGLPTPLLKYFGSFLCISGIVLKG